MLTTVEGMYRNGQIELAESPDAADEEMPVLVTFLSSRIDLRTRGIGKDEAAKLRAQLAPFAKDWESPEMMLYDDYDAARSRQQ